MNRLPKCEVIFERALIDDVWAMTTNYCHGDIMSRIHHEWGFFTTPRPFSSQVAPWEHGATKPLDFSTQREYFLIKTWG
jgi:hypothetical protein